MSIGDTNKLLITITGCIALLLWGTIIVGRTVINRNYHAPTAQQQAVKAYQDCMTSAYKDQSGDCRKITQGQK